MAKESPSRSVASRLRDLLGEATEADVKEMDAEIEAAEETLAKLRANRKLLAQAVGLEEPKKHWTQQRKAKAEPATKPAAAESKDMGEKRKTVLKHLRSVGGSCQLDALSAATRISRYGPGALGTVLAHEWFHVNGDGLATITDKGDRVTL